MTDDHNGNMEQFDWAKEAQRLLGEPLPALFFARQHMAGKTPQEAVDAWHATDKIEQRVPRKKGDET